MTHVVNAYIPIGKLRLSLRILGEGPAMVLFHPSPHSSEMLLPLAQNLASHYTVICVDTPGYGASDALEKPPTNLEDYTTIFYEAFIKLNLKKIALYGSATGAQLAIRYAVKYPQMVSHVFLDNAAHFEDDFRAKLLNHYFPDVTPQRDGTHLNVIWKMVNAMFQYFPWCFQEKPYRLNIMPPPLKVVHHIALDFLKAGKNYHYAYRAAFLHEHAKHVQQLQVETTIFRWEGSIIIKYIDALLNVSLPDHIQSVSIPAEAVARMKTMTQHMKDKATSFTAYKVPERIGTDDKEHANQFVSAIPHKAPPVIDKNGLHLLSAWEMLQKYNPEMGPEMLQKVMVAWFIMK